MVLVDLAQNPSSVYDLIAHFHEPEKGAKHQHSHPFWYIRDELIADARRRYFRTEEWVIYLGLLLADLPDHFGQARTDELRYSGSDVMLIFTHLMPLLQHHYVALDSTKLSADAEWTAENQKAWIGNLFKDLDDAFTIAIFDTSGDDHWIKPDAAVARIYALSLIICGNPFLEAFPALRGDALRGICKEYLNSLREFGNELTRCDYIVLREWAQRQGVQLGDAPKVVRSSGSCISPVEKTSGQSAWPKLSNKAKKLGPLGKDK